MFIKPKIPNFKDYISGGSILSAIQLKVAEAKQQRDVGRSIARTRFQNIRETGDLLVLASRLVVLCNS